MKVDAFPAELPDMRWDTRPRRPHIQAKRVLPFTASPVGTRMHRVRSCVIYPPTARLPGHLSISTWCGTSSGRWALYADPGEMEVCGTCEGRAIGAGQIEAPPGSEHVLLFSPRLPLARCDWEARWGTHWNLSYGPCGRLGVAVATRYGPDGPETTHVVCKQHEPSARRKGFVITEGVPLDPVRS